MHVIITKGYEEMSSKAFELMKEVVTENPAAVLGLATGTTPLGLYERMARDHKENGTSYKQVRTVNLDEYEGLDLSSDQSYIWFMRQDIQVLGIGSNGHIAFNEPGTSFEAETHLVDLAESTIRDNSRLFARIEDVPRRAYTMGPKNIMNAKKILILASGANKAKAVLGLVEGEVTEQLPASILQRHPDCTLVCDEAAASLL